MMARITRLCSTALAAVLLLNGSIVNAQQEDDEIDTSLEPRPAVMAARASSALLLDVTRAGGQLVAVGQRGNILRSQDGKTWQQAPVPVDTTLTRVRFADAQHGWAVGYDAAVLATEDGGQSWQQLHYDARWARPYYDIHFTDSQNGLVAGANGTLLATHDAGQSWAQVESDAFEEGPNLYNLIVLGDGSLLIAGERGFLARSFDAGQTWQRLNSPYSGPLFGALPINQKGLLIFGLRGNVFYAENIDQCQILTTEIRQAQLDAELDPEQANTLSALRDVPGWRAMDNESTESLYGGTVGANGQITLVGGNGHVMQVSLSNQQVTRLPITPANNMNAGVMLDHDLVVAGTNGVQRIALTP